MPNGQRDVMAQAVYLAQLEAAKNNCKCRTCQILRKATSAITDQFLKGNPANPSIAKDPDLSLEIPGDEEE